MNENASKIVPLSEPQRSAALEAARSKIAGTLVLADEPVKEAFNAATHGHFPPRVTQAITALCVLVLVAAFLPSAMRLHKVGFDAFALVFTHLQSLYFAALCIVLMAEFGEVVFVLGASNAQTRWSKLGMWAGAAICTAIALSGNAIAVGQHAGDNLFAFLETFSPPVLVLLISNILKGQILDAIQDRHAAADAFQKAHDAWATETAEAKNAWRDAFDNAHLHHSWMRVSANALREALRRANAQRTTVLRELTDADWLALVGREMNADAWFERAQPLEVSAPIIIERTDERTDQPAPRVGLPSGDTGGRYTGELDNTVTENADGTFTATCPTCGKTFTGVSAKRAKMSLVGHQKSHQKQTE